MTRLTDRLLLQLVDNATMVLLDQSEGTEILIPVDAIPLTIRTMEYFQRATTEPNGPGQ